MSRIISRLSGILMLTIVTVGLGTTAGAQDTRRYVYFAPGAQAKPAAKGQVYEGGGGAERLLDRGLAVRSDLALLTYSDGEGKRTVGGIGSINASYHLQPRKNADPFVAAGYSLQFRANTTNMVNVGGGIHYWFREDRGLLLEIRDHYARDQPTIKHYWTVRVGLVFR